ncbi:MAG: branched-chain amino acid transaminase [Planctomycetes bacterium]|nr:branched-chain amino acid transaminase [Planctomycetota bacterium]
MNEPFAKKLWLDGRIADWAEGAVHLSAHVLHYGSSVFEGIRCYQVRGRPRIFRLREHLERLRVSAAIYRMETGHATDRLAQACRDVVKANNFPACYLRPLVYRGEGAMGVNGLKSKVHTAILAWEWGAYLGPDALEKGVDVGVSSWRRLAPDTMPSQAKAGGNYLSSQLIKMEAVLAGFHEGIALDQYGLVSEGSGENVFTVKDQVLRTPPGGSSILQGVTRDCVIRIARDEGFEVREESFPREALYAADEIFCCGTAAEITPVRSVDRIPIGGGKRGPVTTRVQNRFLGIVHGDLDDKWGWLDREG